MKTIFVLLALFLSATALLFAQRTPEMYFGDTSGPGRPFAKDPMVVRFKGEYLLYYSNHTETGNDKDGTKGWWIGIAKSTDLHHWQKAGEIKAAAPYEKQGLCAPGALVRNGVVHLFYQTYGNGPKDAICHATSTDGIHFTRDESNPIFSPTGSWTNGRAIDAEVHYFKNKYYLYFATRDSTGRIQKQGVATAPAGTNFNRSAWTQAVDSSILKPELAWEGDCVEGASVITNKGKLYMFYAGNYNNAPQQIGIAVSNDGITWKRLSNEPFIRNGAPGTWNSSESGHPGIFKDADGKTWLFYQGNNDKGRTWYLSNLEIGWNKNGPFTVNK